MVRKQYLIAGLIMAAVFVAAWLSPVSDDKFAEVYEKLRPSLFTGFFTLSSFLLSMKTFILLRLKTDVYDTTKYKELLANLRTAQPELPQYGPLNNLSGLIFASIATALVASLAQFSLGVFPYRLCQSAALGFAGMGFYFVVRTLFEIRRNMVQWFEYIEHEAKHDAKD